MCILKRGKAQGIATVLYARIGFYAEYTRIHRVKSGHHLTLIKKRGMYIKHIDEF